MSGLPHGVMVALQILVLPVEVRILVRQQSTREADFVSQLLCLYKEPTKNILLRYATKKAMLFSEHRFNIIASKYSL